jgi:hypothetical protein
MFISPFFTKQVSPVVSMVKLFDFKSRTTSMFIVVLPVPELFVPVTVYCLTQCRWSTTNYQQLSIKIQPAGKTGLIGMFEEQPPELTIVKDKWFSYCSLKGNTITKSWFLQFPPSSSSK